jgi:hypothetical protein
LKRASMLINNSSETIAKTDERVCREAIEKRERERERELFVKRKDLIGKERIKMESEVTNRFSHNFVII